jgi:hypothetical protein
MAEQSTVFYPSRGTTKQHGQAAGRRTQYGWTSNYCNLELHMGNYMYQKRGGLYRAFLFDPIDYRYHALMESLGIDSVPALGALIGSYIGQEGEKIRFRVTEDEPTDIVLCYDYNPKYLDELSRLHHVAVSVAQTGLWAQAVFGLARVNHNEAPRSDLYDGLYDLEPDVADLVTFHAHEELEPATIIDTRLRRFGFR